MTGIADKIMQRVSVHDPGTWVATPKDFVDLGNRDAVDQALCRLVKAEYLRRVSHGLYDVPRISEYLNKIMPTSMDAVISALQRRDSTRFMEDGLVAANGLGLTNAVPARYIYSTDGHSRILKIGRQNLQLEHAGPKIMFWAGRPAEPVVQALRWLGPHIVTDLKNSKFIVTQLRNCLPASVKFDLWSNSRNLPGWALPVARDVASDAGVAA